MQSAVQSAVQLIAPILILITEIWATEQSCIHIEITSCKIPSLVSFKVLSYIMKPEKVTVQKDQDYGH